MACRDSRPKLTYRMGKIYFHIVVGRKRGLIAISQVICAALRYTQNLHHAKYVRLIVFLIGNNSPALYEASPRLLNWTKHCPLSFLANGVLAISQIFVQRRSLLLTAAIPLLLQGILGSEVSFWLVLPDCCILNNAPIFTPSFSVEIKVCPQFPHISYSLSTRYLPLKACIIQQVSSFFSLILVQSRLSWLQRSQLALYQLQIHSEPRETHYI